MSKPQSDNLMILNLFRRSSLPDKIALLLSGWFGAGLLPLAPGTWGTIAAVPIIFFTKDTGLAFKWFFLAVFIGIAVWAADRCSVILEREDPAQVVIDEVAGFMVTTLFLPFSWLSVWLGFFLFRLFDIIKPFPIKHLERLPGGVGIVADDLLAGLYACLGMIFFHSFLQGS
jgi:phosphatidylglycerophosphatase A